MLFHSLSALISGVYVGQLVARLQKDIDLCALERAWQCVVDRHQALRTTFHWDRVTEPVQQVHSDVRVNIEVHDWRDVSVEKEREALDAYLLNDQVRGFDLSTPPLMRFSLLQLPQGEHFLVWTHHHALLDGRARVIVLKEVARLYDAFRRGEAPNLAAPPLYRDYVEWFYSQERSGEEEYWGGLLQTFTSPVSVSFFETKPPLDGKRFRTREIFLPSGLKNSLQAIARKNKVTANILIQAIWAALLSRYSGQEDIVFGETRACRRPDFEGIGSLVGVLMNTLPVRLDTSPPRSFSVLLADLRNQHVSLRDHEHSSLSDIRKWSGVSNKAQLFESIVVFEEYELNAALKHDGCSLWSNGVYRTMPTHYPLTLVGYGKPDLFLSITYDSLSISDAAAEQIARHFQTLLQSALAMPDAPLARLPLIGAPEREQLLLLGNKPESLDHQYPRSLCVHQLFEQQVQLAPLAIALLTET
ncbi:MAG TPA: condensation domain-containing protein, partial [Candidatus Angelobacter sp.]|nr:condensation domain-containing protein [Candidatus Angelobacter sp.]